MMSLSELIQTHGYWMLAIGCLLEGETVLLLAGFAAHRGYLDPVAVLAIAAIAGFTGDQGFFWLGRRHGAAVLARWPAVARQEARVQRLVARSPGSVIVFMRFAYGLRLAGPVLMGMSPIGAVRFAAWNGLGAALWATAVGGAGWAFGHAAEAALGHIRELEGVLALVLVFVGLGLWGWQRWRRRQAPP